MNWHTRFPKDLKARMKDKDRHSGGAGLIALSWLNSKFRSESVLIVGPKTLEKFRKFYNEILDSDLKE